MKRESCEGCAHDLGGGCCGISAERECREGGGFELYQENLEGDGKVVKTMSNRFTPEKVKKALECHIDGVSCHECPFFGRSSCSGPMSQYALAYIQQLEQGHRELSGKVGVLTEALGRYLPEKPLTFDDAVASSAVWLEVHAQNDVPRVCEVYIDTDVDGRTYASVMLMGNARRAMLIIEHYGSSWRCWRHKPTDEERRNAKWQ